MCAQQGWGPAITSTPSTDRRVWMLLLLLLLQDSVYRSRSEFPSRTRLNPVRSRTERHTRTQHAADGTGAQKPQQPPDPSSSPAALPWHSHMRNGTWNPEYLYMYSLCICLCSKWHCVRANQVEQSNRGTRRDKDRGVPNCDEPERTPPNCEGAQFDGFMDAR